MGACANNAAGHAISRNRIKTLFINKENLKYCLTMVQSARACARGSLWQQVIVNKRGLKSLAKSKNKCGVVFTNTIIDTYISI